MKKLTLLICFMAMSLFVSAQKDYTVYYKNLPISLEMVQPIVIPQNEISIEDCGAVANSEELATEAIEKAISRVFKQGGGRVLIPAGRWISGPIKLRSNIELHLDKNATLVFTDDKTQYLARDNNGNLTGKCYACIRANKCENIAITGQGTIDGNGLMWRPVKYIKVSNSEWKKCLELGGTVVDKIWYPFNLNNGLQNIASTPQEQEKMRTHLIVLNDCKNVLLEGVKLMNAPKFHFVPTRCANLIIDGVTIRCPWNAQNGDAIDICNTQVALVVNCNISCGDDGICLKGGVAAKGESYGPDRDILIMNDTVYRAHGGFVIGSEFSGGMRKIVVRNCRFEGTEIGLRFKSAPGRGGWCEDIFCQDLIMKDIQKDVISFNCGYADKGSGFSATAKDDKSAYFPDFAHFTFRDILCVGAQSAIKIEGMKYRPVHDLLFENITILNVKEGLSFKFAENLTFNECKIRSKKGDIFDYRSCKNILFNGKDLLEE